jgi:hypothetical protein
MTYGKCHTEGSARHYCADDSKTETKRKIGYEEETSEDGDS